MTIRLYLARLKSRFLGRFAEVRSLRTIEARMEAALREAHAATYAEKWNKDTALGEIERLNLALEEKTRGLAVMTDARLNADRAAEVLRGQIDTLREMSEREIASMKQVVDCFALQAIGRQVHGTAPQGIRPMEAEAAPKVAGVTARQASRVLTEQFFAEAMKRGQQPPPNGAEYPSTQQYSTESVATIG